MEGDSKRLAGIFLAAGAAQYILAIILAEAVYPNFSPASNWLRDLSIGQAAYIFDPSVIFLGICILIGTYYLLDVYDDIPLLICMSILGLGSIATALFTQSTGAGGLVSITIYAIGSTAAILSSQVQDRPVRYFSIVLGALSFCFSVMMLFAPNLLGLDPGTMSKLIIYPLLIWGIVFGTYLMTRNKEDMYAK